jgi:hypothetical protein
MARANLIPEIGALPIAKVSPMQISGGASVSTMSDHFLRRGR